MGRCLHKITVKTRGKVDLMQIACGNRISTSCSKINRAILKSEFVFPTKQFPCQYQAAINSCKQSFVDSQNKIKTQTNKIYRFAMYLTCFGCQGASNKAKIKVNTDRSLCFIFLLSIQWQSISGGGDYAPNHQKVDGACCFWGVRGWVRGCVTLFVPTVTFKPLKLES